MIYKNQLYSKLKNKVIIITGTSNGLGKEIALNCLKYNMKVVLIDKITPSFLKTIDKKIFLFLKADVSSGKMVKTIVDKTIKKFGEVNFLINNVGIGGPLAFVSDYNEKDWDKIINTNLRSVFLFCKECVKKMIKNKSGHIINISSIVGRTGLPYFSIYSASKGGVNAFSSSLKEELKQFNIKVDTICPGSMNTPFIKKVSVKGKLKNILKPKRINLNKMLDSKHVADIILDIMSCPPKIYFEDIIIKSKYFNP